ncbi:MAG: DUF3078 domain-containing protein [Muribaculaceae bacterium]|nr:DUF3078 domain-containing protein [Muribaculaceae bacterium]
MKSSAATFFLPLLLPLSALAAPQVPAIPDIPAPVDNDSVVMAGIARYIGEPGFEEPDAEQLRKDSLDAVYAELMRERDLEEILASIPDTGQYSIPYLKYGGPWIFSGYRTYPERKITAPAEVVPAALPEPVVTVWQEGAVPAWLQNSMTAERMQDRTMYAMMMQYPHLIEYAYWDLPVPPVLPEDDVSFHHYITTLNLPQVDMGDAIIPEFEVERTHWLHNATAGLQFSQAYVSSNWYQGGNDYLALLVNLGWNVTLNKVYHPKLLFESVMTYKLGLNQTSSDTYHKYSISEDLFQYNAKAGYKATKNWYYSVTAQFKTQFFNSYATNSPVRTASFLSPGDLNFGVGMTYSYANKKNTFKFNASIAPFSYNLKTCIDTKIDPTQFGIKAGRKTNSEFGSNAELTANWTITSNISCKTRLFLFTDYSYSLGDLETTWNFTINRFLSTQIYAHLRYDSSSDARLSEWRHWMLKEILSFGLTYTFSTKPS